MQRKRHPSLEARRVARIGTSLFAAAALQRQAFYLATFFNITKTNVFCAKRRVGHACICPRMVTG